MSRIGRIRKTRKQVVAQKNPDQHAPHDPYFIGEKLSDGSVCRKCGIVFEQGVFRRSATEPHEGKPMTCPACRREADGVPGGEVVLSGAFLGEHEAEIRNLIHNIETAEEDNHALQRVMSITPTPGGLRVLTTYEHIARRIGSAVHRAYGGNLAMDYADSEKFVRITWNRD
ncbi:MAG: zinc ribbon domain-containing protein [Bdellovibrionales bacterium]|nr:zinc ribbon domain-containing protein [Bdellovibrionales bacterium]